MAADDAAVEHSPSGDNDGPTPPAIPSSMPIADAVAIASAGQVETNPQLTAGVLAYLSDQRGLCGQQQEYLRLQMEHLHEQRKLTVSHMHWQHLGDVLRGTMYVALALVTVGAMVALAATIWNAAQYRGVLVEAFAVPPDLEQRGYTGAVVSQKLLDRVRELQAVAATSTIVALSTVEVDWGDDLKVEIPETGVSLGEVGHYLRRHLGTETRINGDVVRTASGIAINARVDGRPAGQVEGSEAEIDALIVRAGERVMSLSQPYHYAGALTNLGRGDEGMEVYARLASSGTPQERAMAYVAWSYRLLDRGDFAEAEAKARATIRLFPDLGTAYYRLWDVGYSQGRFESALQNASTAETKFRTDTYGFYGSESLHSLHANIACEQLLLNGDLQSAIDSCREASVRTQTGPRSAGWLHTMALGHGHDLIAAHSAEATIDESLPVSLEVQAQNSRRRAEAVGTLQLARENWDGAVAAYERGIDEAPSRALPLKPWLAYALACKGDMSGADTALQDTPDDCYPCLRARGKIASLKKAWPEAERWFAEAARQGPSLPWANTDWAEMLIAKGDAQGAIAQAREAIQRGPKFADAYQALGEALALSGDYADAVKQFQQAATYAPKWGRTQIQWGIALGKLGRNAEAQAKFTVAKTFELVPSEQLLLRMATSERGVANEFK